MRLRKEATSSWTLRLAVATLLRVRPVMMILASEVLFVGVFCGMFMEHCVSPSMRRLVDPLNPIMPP